MSNLDEFFKSEVVPEHPMVRAWAPLLEDKRFTATCEVNRQRDGLSYRPTKIYVHFSAVDPALSRTDSVDWDLDLNRFLIIKGVRAVDPKNEELRFALSLKELWRKTEIRLGDGYFSALLVETLGATGFSGKPKVGAMLAKIGPYSTHKGRTYAESAAAVKDPLKTCAAWLTHNLQYAQDDAEAILDGAIASYLDDRFSVTNRNLLGFS